MKLLLIILIFALLSCTKQEKRIDTLSVSISSEISTMDPANCYDQICYYPVTQIYEPLFEMEYLKRPYTLRPLLAESFPVVSANKLIYTFKIKKGIKYHNNEILAADRTVKAQDFINQIKRLAFQQTISQGWWLFDGKIKGLNEFRNKAGTDLNKFFALNVEGLRAIDDQTLVIELIEPYPQILYALAMTFTAPIPEEAIKATQNDLSQKFFGTGAYSVVSYNPQQEIVLKKNTHYISSTYPTQADRYGHENGLLKDSGAKLPFIENIKFIVMKEAQTEWLNFLSKKIDLINLTKDLFHIALTADGKLKPEITEQNIKLQATPTLTYWWLQFNMKDSFMKNINLRKAIAHAINIEKYIELFTYNIAQKANSIYPPGVPGYSPSSELPFQYDLNKAKEYLAKAGYPNGKGLPTLTFDVRGTDARRRQMGEFIQKELSSIGINIAIRTNSFPAFLEKSRKGELQFWQGGWILDYPDAENVLQLLNSENLPPGPNSSQYNNPEFDKLFRRLKALEDNGEKFMLMAKMEEMVNKDLPWAMQYYSRNYILHHDYLLNFRYSDLINNSFKYLKLRQE